MYSQCCKLVVAGGGGGFATATIANCVATYMLIWPMYILFVI